MFFKSMKTAGSSVEKGIHPALDETSFCSGGHNAITDVWEYPSINNKITYLDEKGNTVTEVKFHQHTSPSYFFSKIKFPEIYKDYRKITIVRNPWEVMLSYYWWSKGHMKEQWESKAGKEMSIEPSDSIEETRRKFMNYICGLARFRTHRSVLESEDGFEYNHPVKWVAKEMEGFVDDNYITDYMRFEKLESHFKKLCLYLKEDLQLPRLKSDIKKAKNEHYSYFYSKDAEEIVRNAFPKTIEKFGYTFDRRVK